MRNNCFKVIVASVCSAWLLASVEGLRAQSIPLITVDTEWRYNQTGTNLPTTWTSRTYNDTVTGWEGPALGLFGYETDENQYNNLGVSFYTRFPDPQTAGNFRTNYYFRAHFTNTTSYSPSLLAAITLNTTNFIDDGAVFYLNGTELARWNMPATGTITAATFASAGFGDPGRFVTNYMVGTNLLVGDNVVAVELHQNATGSSDEVFGMTMNLVLPTPPVVTFQPYGITNLLGSANNVLSVTATGSTPLGYQWYSNGVRIVASGTLASYNVSSAKTNDANFFCVVSNVAGFGTSDTVRVSIILDTFPPVMLSANTGPPPSSTASNQVLITFNERMDTATAGAASNYLVTILGTTNKVGVNLAQASANQVKLTLASYLGFGTNYILTVNRVADTNKIPILPNSQIPIGFPFGFPSTNDGVLLFPMEQPWYWTETYDDFGTTWRGTNYVESPDMWGGPPFFDGQGLLWYDNAGTTLCDGTPGQSISWGYYTYYLRTRFVAPSNAAPSGTLRLRTILNDGAVFYLNGTEIFRLNMPASPRTIDYSTQPLAAVATRCVTNTITVTNLMRPGTNLLAVEWHQFNPFNQFVIYFGASADYVFSTTPPLPNLRVTPIMGATNFVSWTTNTAGVLWGLETTTNLGSAWVPINVTSPYTNSSPGRRFFRIHVK
jgi:hypothetical protein